MGEDTTEARRLDRRGFLGAAAGVAAAGASATAWGTFANKASARTDDSCTEVAAGVPKARRGCIHFTTPAQAWNTTALFGDFITFAKGLSCNAWEFAGSYPTVAANNVNGSNGTVVPGVGLSGWIALGSYAKTYGFRVVGTHDGPAPTSAGNLGSAVLKMNAWGCNQLGAGGGYPSGAVNLPNAGTAITNPSAITAWQESAHTMNTWGQAYQTGTGPVLGSTPYGAGVFAGTAITAGRTCARYYRHFHSEQGKWIQNTGTKYDGHYISEVIYTETDPNVAYAQSDQCWLLDGLWMAGGSAPSVGIQGAGEPNPGQGRNRLVQPDLVERWQDRIFAFHIKDLGTGTAINDQGTGVCNVGDNAGPGNATGNYPVDTIPANGWSVPSPYGAIPWATDGSQDSVQFQKIYERFRHPECHEYLFERDGMSNTVTSNAYWRKLYVQAFDMMEKLVFARTPGIIRTPSYVPKPTDGADVWQSPAQLWLPYNSATGSARPPVGNGSPGPTTCKPTIAMKGGGAPRVGYAATVDFKGTWTRYNYSEDEFCYQWLRDGAPHPSYNGAPIGSKPECTCCGPGQRNYTIQPVDAGHKISCQVTIINDEDSHTVVETNALTVPGCRTDAQVEADLAALKATVAGMGLSAGVKGQINAKIDTANAQLLAGTSPVATLNSLNSFIAGTNNSQISAAQKASLTAAVNAIIAEYANPC